jgi:hypothetical protein
MVCGGAPHNSTLGTRPWARLSVPEVQKADPGTRRFTLVCLVMATAVGSAAFVLLERHSQSLLSWLLTNEPHVQLSIIVVGLLLLLLPLLLTAAWMWRFGVRVLRGNRHPPEGMRVVRDTPVIHGAGARLYGRLYQALATLFVLTALSVCGSPGPYGAFSKSAVPQRRPGA